MKAEPPTLDSLKRLVRTLRWVKVKPQKPGEYFTRWAEDGSCVNAVTVTKTGRGLSVYCAAYNDRVTMSKIGETELEWAERPNDQSSVTAGAATDSRKTEPA
jgi:hypothetical protein